ncbi:MAG: hypothetical protein HDS14_05180 [Bacteroides sp.]|nr:hypothetical protein [Bacteroides sp.]
MIFSPKDNDDNDFFDGPDIPEEPVKPKAPEPTPDTPDYWEEESEWEHLRPIRRWRSRLFIILTIVAAIIMVFGYIWFFNPYVKEATQFGYIEELEYRGTIFKTYEGVMLPYKELHDTTRIYTRDFIFTVEKADVAARMKRFQIAGRPVRVEYKRYHSILPWRGESKVVVVAADSVDPATILPPEFAPRNNGIPVKNHRRDNEVQ